jgi:hypothetical protein
MVFFPKREFLLKVVVYERNRFKVKERGIAFPKGRHLTSNKPSIWRA